VDGGETGLLLQHGATTTAQWGISTVRTGNYVGNLIFRTRTANATNALRLTITNGGDLLPGTDSDQDLGSSTLRWQTIHGDVYLAKDSLRIGDASTNAEADVQFKGAGASPGGGRNFRVGNNIGAGVDVFAIYSSGTDGGTDWKNTLATPLAPALAIQGTNNRLAINTTDFSGTDNTDPDNPVNRDYILNVGGDVNINGQLFQNNAEFVTSRWTEATNGDDIYRLSRVGINKADPEYTLDCDGDFNVTGALYVNGIVKWIDAGGIINIAGQTISENLTTPQNSILYSYGNITINSGYAVTVGAGTSWTIY